MVFLNVTLPMFALIFAGVFAVKRGFLDDGGTKGLAMFAFYFAIPLLLFRTMALLSFADGIDVRFFVHYLAAGACAYIIGMIISRFAFGADLAGQSIFGMSACFGNLAIIALPITIDVFGPKATLPMTMLVLLEAIVFMPLTIIILEVRRSRLDLESNSGLAGAVAKGGKAVIINPIIMSMLLGVLASALSISLPVMLDEFAQLVGAAAIPCALFALGASLARTRNTDRMVETGAMTLMKLGLYPVLVFIAMSLLPSVDPVWRATAILASAMPIGANLYLVAEAFNAHVGRASTAVMVSTVLSAATVSALAAYLGANL